MTISKTSGRKALLALATAALLPLTTAACAANEGKSQAPSDKQSEAGQPGESGSGISGTFNGAGASAQEAAQASWIAAFQEANGDVTINYNPIGSGDGRKQFIEGAITYAGSDSFLSDEEIAGEFARCTPDTKALDLPVYISPIAVAFNVEGVDALNFDPQTLAKVFKGEIKTWDDPAIKAINPDASLPATAITVVHRSDDSGTTKNFTDYLNKTAPEIWTEKAEDKFPFSFPGAEGAQGTTGVVQAISSGSGTIGYADASKIGDLPTAAIKVGDEFVTYSPQGAAKVVDASPLAEGRPANDVAVKLDRNTTEPGAYPLVLVSYLIVCSEYKDDKDAQFVKSYASYIASPEGQAASQEGAGSAPISDTTRAAVQRAIDSIK